MFDRLVGLETEYALRFRTPVGIVSRPPNEQFYRAVINELGRRMPTATALATKEGVFLANGGAVWFERSRPDRDAGLIEGATPECRGPRQALCYQRAQDRLLAEAAASARLPGELTLVKNDRDSRGNIYGAQENYQALLGGRAAIFAWRTGVLLLWPLVVLSWLGLLLAVVALFTYLFAAAVLYAVVHPFLVPSRRRAFLRRLFGEGLLQSAAEGEPILPDWVENAFLAAVIVVTFPLAMAVYALARCFAHRSLRQQLLPFLISRAVVSGAGMVDAQGRFHLADKAPGLNCLLGYSGYIADRPLFSIGHFLKALIAFWPWSTTSVAQLFSARQRLQISLGDSNMADEAEYLRLGTTLLVIDAIEAGVIGPTPRLKYRPLDALRRVCADPSLRTPVASIRGQAATALDLQQHYLARCRQYVLSQPQPAPEALEVLRRWRDVLDAIAAQNTSQLIGRIDWVTKQWLIQQAQTDRFAEKKKIDLRYHELSPQGYYRRLQTTGQMSQLVSEAEIERAMRNPPANTPATTRGRYIREFAAGSLPLSVAWDRIRIGRGRRATVIRLRKFRRPS